MIVDEGDYMLDNIFNDYYFQSIFYCIVIIFISMCVIKVMKKRNVNLKDRVSFDNISWQFLVRIICFSFFIRIIFEQILIYLNISQTYYKLFLAILQVVKCHLLYYI